MIGVDIWLHPVRKQLISANKAGLDSIRQLNVFVAYKFIAC